MRRLFTILVLAVGVFEFAGPARACSCAMLEPEQMLESFPTAFVGTITGVTPSGRGELGATHALTFEVETVLAGEVAREVDVVTADNSAGCGIDAVIGTRMAVFAADDGGILTSGLCSATDPDLAIAAVGPGSPLSGAAVPGEGSAFDWEAFWLGLGGVGVVGAVWWAGRRRLA
ncbi:MAG: hypothetical protein ACRDWH_09950 [Acidimicrobiia bacterium]